MKLLIILSVVAFGYADKLDRTYLPPPNAGTAGGSPGSLIAPGAPTSFGQGLPSSSSSLSGSSNFGASGFNQGSNNGPLESGSGFKTSGFGQSSGTSFGSNIGQSATFSGQQSGFNGLSGAQSFALDDSEGAQNKPGLGQKTNFGVSNAGNPQENAFGSIKESGAPSFGPVSGPSGSNTFGSSQVGFGSGQANAYAAPQPERPQAAADRNAEILKYINENNGESYNYSYETSNGISAEETGVATNGVKAQGGFAYTGDDGTRYSLTYTADENGFQPQGEHLPTPHPIPEEILKSIEENARAAAAGTQEGAYRPEEYESENSIQQYNAGSSDYGQTQGQNINQGQGVNQPQSQQSQYNTQAQYPTNQDISSKGQLSGLSGSNNQIQSNQASNRFSSGANGINGQNGQYQQGFGSNSQGVTQSSSGQNTGQNVQRVQNNGYEYSQPQNGFGSQKNQRPSAQTGPQIEVQKPTSYSSSLAQVSGSNDRGIFGPNRPTGGASFQSNEIQTGFSNGSPQQGQQPSFGSNQPSFASNQQSFGSNQPSFGSKQGQPPSFGPSQSISGATSIFKQEQQPTLGSNQPSFGYKPEQQPSFGSSQSLSGAASISKQGQQPTFGSNLPPFGSAGTGSQSSFGSSQSSFGPAGISQQGEQPTFGSNQLSFGSAGNSNQGQQTQIGSSQSPFGSKQTSLGQSLQSQQQTFGSVGSSDKGYQYGINANQPAFNSGKEMIQGSQFGNKPSSPNVGSGQRLPFAPEVQGGSSNAARPQYQQNRNQPSFGSNTPNQGPQFGLNGQFGQRAAGMSTSTGSLPRIQPQYNQPGQQPAFGPSGPQSNGGLNSGASGSEFGGPRQPPSFSPQEGYKY